MITVNIQTNLPLEKVEKIVKEISDRFDLEQKSEDISEWFSVLVDKSEGELLPKFKIWDNAVIDMPWTTPMYIKIYSLTFLKKRNEYLYNYTSDWSFPEDQLRKPTTNELNKYFIITNN